MGVCVSKDMPDDIPTDIFADDFDAIAGRGYVTLTWTPKGGVAVPGIVGLMTTVDRKQRNIDPGWLAEFSAEIHIADSQFPSAQVQRGDQFSIGGTSYQVMSFRTEPSAAVLIFQLNSTTQ